MKNWFWVLSAVIVLASCGETSQTSSGAFGPDRPGASNDSNQQRSGFASRLFGQDRSAISRGDDQFINTDALAAAGPGRADIEIVDDSSVEVTLVNASIEAAANAVLDEVLGQPFTIADGVDGRITIQTTGPIPKSSLLALFEASLSANGARIEIENGIAVIRPGAIGNRTFRTPSDTGIDGSTIVVAPLKFISATQMAKLLEPLTQEGLQVVVDQDRSLLLLSGRAGAMNAAIDALNLFDVDVMRGKSIALVSLQAADPNDVVEELRAIFESREGGLLEGVIDFVPNSRLSSVLVISARSRYIDDAQRWIRELDRTAGRSQRFTKVYRLNNRRASEIAPILDGLLSDGATSTAEGEISASSGSRIAADPDRNALIVRAVQADHDEVARLLIELDSRARQVALEATIAEVTLNDEVSLGVRWFIENNANSATFSDATNGSISSNFPGFSSVFSASNSEAVLNALAGVTDVRVISSPTLVVLDNREAVLQIGDEVPVAVQTATPTDDADTVITTTIDYRDTGVILTVNPQIGASGNLTLDVSQEVSSVALTNSSGIDSPTIRQRRITTSVLLNDGATLVLGGLVQESDNRTDTKVPGLGDVPFVGSAFRTRSSEKDRTELLILIRPRIIHDPADARAYTTEWRSHLSNANAITDTGLGAPTHSIEEILR
ncbi:type II secretion system secretin GspD [Cognatiyoonia sp. IB215182]|uniref:type II secretion system secretin GspD n=1 Tax=Cognatiyoonia sp. IB215182 TaxID=3097353 RepID=UPI002A0E80A6|nr:type II secretion system secretin GspD [Cognatiyoonia sp. IB215182]MDX8355267.1 type II secretion system secretin GspD [Cognatiyoonia sp. IB215182]